MDLAFLLPNLLHGGAVFYGTEYVVDDLHRAMDESKFHARLAH